MPKIKTDMDINETFKRSKDYYPVAKSIKDEVFDALSDHFKLFRGFYRLDMMFERHNLTDPQKHFLTSLFFRLLSGRESPEKNAKLEKMIQETYKNLGYEKSRLYDDEFNRKRYNYVMLTSKGI